MMRRTLGFACADAESRGQRAKRMAASERMKGWDWKGAPAVELVDIDELVGVEEDEGDFG